MDMNFSNLADMVAETNIQPLMEAIEQVMSIPEESLNDNNIEVISGMMRGAFTDKIREQSIDDLLEQFENENLSKAAALRNVEMSKQGLQEIIDSLQPSPNKKKLLDSIFSGLVEIFDAAAERYHSYAIELPMKLEKGAKIPTYAHDTDACADLYASQDITIPAHSLSNVVPTGLHIALPESWVLKFEPRSSIGLKTGLRLSNSMAIIDEDYRGEIGILFDNFSDSDFKINAGDRIVQCWIEKVYRFKPVEVDVLPTTERGEGGFGSTGK